MKLAITGLGNVGTRLLELIERKREIVAARFQLDLVIAGVCDSSGAVIDRKGLDPLELLSMKKQKQGVALLSGGVSGMTPAEFVQAVEADALVELTLTNLKDGEPGLGAIRNALVRKMHVVSANKGPLVLAYTELANLAKSNGVKFMHSATVAGGLPVLNIGVRDLCAVSIDRIEGVLNGTTNYILSEMTDGKSYSDVLKRAQEIGMAEADPSLDVDGWDAACKLVIIANAVLQRPTTLSDVSVQGISGITPQQLKDATSHDQVWKLIALAERKENDYQFSVRPTLLERSHPLAGVSAGMMAVLYQTDINGNIFASIVEMDPYPTAAAVLRDIVHISS